eukprot:snap_masked-scaffold1226_size54525-processed-gene-0.1 protein:Tk01310 transcript:snap_masked-scaffold1226_size54525-processed-gene-0.1-mRNA-1 annotation:"disulfide-isomerase a3 precursor"
MMRSSYVWGLASLLMMVGPSTQSRVLDLGDADFEGEMEKLDTVLVMFYAPWCGHCKRMKPEFDKAGDLLANHDPPIHFAKVDCTEAGKDTCARFEVRGYPTLKIFRGGELAQDYNGPREVQGIVKYMQGQVGPASKSLASAAELTAFKERRDVVVIASFGSARSDDLKVFLKTAEAMREDVRFAHCSDEKICGFEGVIIHRPSHLQTKLEETDLTFDGDMKKDKLKAWIEDNYHGFVGHRTIDNVKDFQRKPLVVAYYDVDYVKNEKGTNYWRNRIMKVAKSFYPEIHFAISNKDDFMQEMNEFGLSGLAQGTPDVVLTGGDGRKFVMSETFAVDTFQSFLEQWQGDKLEAYLKSEDIPDNSAVDVKVAVAKNFDELVAKSEKDVLIEFYAPWCGHCKKLTPIFDELGANMADEEVEIVKMDATANDVPPGYDVRGFPTLFWLPKGTKTPVQYQGGRELPDFVSFIAENASEELKSLDRKGKAKKSEL